MYLNLCPANSVLERAAFLFGQAARGRRRGGEVVDVPHDNNNRSIYRDWTMQDTDRQSEAEVRRECCGVWEAQFRTGSTICCLLGL